VDRYVCKPRLDAYDALLRVVRALPDQFIVEHHEDLNEVVEFIQEGVLPDA
jgi:hypothetical protein